MKRSLLGSAAVAAALLAAAPALAHALLAQASPAAGSSVSAAPAEISLRFTEAVEPAFSSISVTDAAGHDVTKGKALRDPRDDTVLRVALPPLPPGIYTVTWRVTSVDTHRTAGSFTFRVAGGAE